MFVPAP